MQASHLFIILHCLFVQIAWGLTHNDLEISMESVEGAGTGLKRVKRQLTPQQEFIKDLQETAVDLIILMDASQLVGRYNFYRKSRPLVSHVLRYYVKMDANHVRVALATYDKQVKWHFDGIQGSLTKCDVFMNYWDNVGIDDTTTFWQNRDIENAFSRADSLFQQSNRVAQKYIWILGHSYYDIQKTTLPASLQTALTRDTQILVTSVVSPSSRSLGTQFILLGRSAVYTWSTFNRHTPLQGRH